MVTGEILKVLLCDAGTCAARLSGCFAIVAVIHRRRRCRVSWRAIRLGQTPRRLLFSDVWRIRCLRTIRTVICGIRLFTACWRWWRFILAWTSPRQVPAFHKFVVVDHPKWTEIVFVADEALMKRQIRSNRILSVHRDRDQLAKVVKLFQFRAFILLFVWLEVLKVERKQKTSPRSNLTRCGSSCFASEIGRCYQSQNLSHNLRKQWNVN